MSCFVCEYEEPIVRESMGYCLSIWSYITPNSFVESKIIVVTTELGEINSKQEEVIIFAFARFAYFFSSIAIRVISQLYDSSDPDA